MLEYQMPPDISEREKIVGGVLSAGQLLWMVGGVAIAVAISISLNKALGVASFIIGIPIGGAFACLFAFVKPHKIPFARYLKLKIRHQRQIKHLVNHDSVKDSYDLDEYKNLRDEKLLRKQSKTKK